MPYSQSETPHSYQNAGPRTDANESSDSDEDQQFDPALHGSIDWNNMLSMPREVFWDGQTGGLSIRHQVPFAASPGAFLSGMLMLLLVTFARQLPLLFQPRGASNAGDTDDDLAGNDALAVTMLALLALIVRACASPAQAPSSALAPIAPRSPHEPDPWYHLARFGFGMGALSVAPHAWQAHHEWQAQRLQHMGRQWFGEELHRVETALAMTEQVWPTTLLASLSQEQMAALANVALPTVPAEVLQSYGDILRDMAGAKTGPEQVRSRRALLDVRTLLLQHTPVELVSTLDGPSTSQAHRRPAGEEAANAGNDGGRVGRWYAAAGAFGASLLPAFLYHRVAFEEMIPMYTSADTAQTLLPETAQAPGPGPDALVSLFHALSPILLSPYRSAMQSSTAARVAVAGGLAGAAVLGTGMYYLSAGTRIESAVDAFLHERYSNETGMSVEDVLIAELYFSLDDPVHATDDELIAELKHFVFPVSIEAAPAEVATSILQPDQSPFALLPELVASKSFNGSATLVLKRERRSYISIEEELEILRKTRKKEADAREKARQEMEEATAQRLLSGPLRTRIMEIHGPISDEAIVELWKRLASELRKRLINPSIAPDPAFEKLRQNRSDSYPRWSVIEKEAFTLQLNTILAPSAANSVSDLNVDQLWLHEFSDSVAPGSEHAGPPVRSTPLVSLLENGMPPGHDWNATELALKAGVYRSETPAAGKAVAITLRTLVDALKKHYGTAQHAYGNALKKFWAMDSTTGIDAETILLAKNILDFASLRRSLEYISEQGINMLAAAAGVTGVDAGTFRAMPLEIGGYYAVDAVVLQHESGTLLLIMPRWHYPVLEFPYMSKMREAIAETWLTEIRPILQQTFPLSAHVSENRLDIDGYLDLLTTPDANRTSLIQNKAREKKIVGNIFNWMAKERQHEDDWAFEKLSNPVRPGRPHVYLEERQRTAYNVPPLRLEPPENDLWFTQLSNALGNIEWGEESGLPTSEFDDSDPGAGIANLSEDRFNVLMRRRMMLGATRQLLHNAAPDIAIEATLYVREILEAEFRIYTDPNELSFTTYEPPYYDQFINTGAKLVLNPNALKVKKTVPLTELAIHSPPYVPYLSVVKDPGDPKGLYLITPSDTVPPKFISSDQSIIWVPRFVEKMRDASKPDLIGRYKAGIKNYYKTYGASLAKYAAQNAMFIADMMLAEGTLSQDDYDIATTAFALDEQSPPTDIEVRVLTLYGHGSIDCLDIYKPGTGRTLLYMPGEDPEIKAFPSRAAAVSWLQGLAQNEEQLNHFVGAHFSIALGEARAKGTFGGEGIKEFLRQEQTGTIERHRGQSGSSITSGYRPPGTRPENYLNGMRLHSSPFLKLNEVAERAASSDAQVFIDSPADERNRWWAQAFDFVPFLDGIIKMSLAKTDEEFFEGVGSFGLDILMAAVPGDEILRVLPVGILRYIPFAPRDKVSHTAVRLVGGKSAAAKNSVVKKFDSFFRPPVLVNGKRGYLLGNPDPPRLRPDSVSRYSPKIEIGDTANLDALAASEYSALSPLVLRKLKVTHEKLLVDAANSFNVRTLSKRGHPDVPLPEGKTVLKDAIPDLFADDKYTGGELGKGLIFTENHQLLSARRGITDGIDNMGKSNVKTMYVEWALHEENEAAFEQYFQTGVVNDILRNTLAEADSVIKSGIGSYGMEKLMINTRAQGIRVVGLDSHTASMKLARQLLSAKEGVNTVSGNLVRQRLSAMAAVNTEAGELARQRLLTAGAVDSRQSGFNHYAEQVIRKHQAANGNQPWVAWVGRKHGVEAPSFLDASQPKIPGLGQRLDAISIYITEPVIPPDWLKRQLPFDPKWEIYPDGQPPPPPLVGPTGYEKRALSY